MGYLLLAVALLCGSAKGFCGKKTSGLLQGYTGSVVGNLLRATVCIVIGLLLVLTGVGAAALQIPFPALAVCALSGLSSAAFMILWIVCVRKSAYMLLDVFLASGMLVPLLLCNIFYGEPISWKQWLGIAMTLAALLLMYSYNNSIKTRLTLSGLLLLVVTGLANGLMDFSQKMIVNSFPQVHNTVFNFYTYLFALAALAAAFLFLRLRMPGEGGDLRTGFRKALPLLLIMAAALFGTSFFKTEAAKYLDAAVLFPLSHGCALILSSAMAALFFKEKLTAKSVIGLALIFAAMVIINM